MANTPTTSTSTATKRFSICESFDISSTLSENLCNVNDHMCIPMYIYITYCLYFFICIVSVIIIIVWYSICIFYIHIVVGLNMAMFQKIWKNIAVLMSQSLEQSILQEAKVGFVKSGWVPGCQGSTNQICAENDGQGNVVSLGTGLSSKQVNSPFPTPPGAIPKKIPARSAYCKGIPSVFWTRQARLNSLAFRVSHHLRFRRIVLVLHITH